MRRFGATGNGKCSTGVRLGTSEGRAWKGLLAERWRHSEGELAEREVGANEIAVLLDGSLPIRKRHDGRLEMVDGVPGMISLCPRGVREDMICLYGEIRESLYLALPESLLSETALSEIDVDPARVRLNCEPGLRDPVIEQIAQAIRAEMINPEPAGGMLVEALVSVLGVHLLRHHSNLNSTTVPLPLARGALDLRRLRRVKEFIEAHLGEELSIEVLAKESRLSPYHFARAFKAATGTPPHSYLMDRRAEKAKCLIAEGRLSLYEIAQTCGFSSQAYFTTWFKRLCGVTPGAYGRRCA